MSDSIRLRDVLEADLPLFFEQQRDPVACRMVAFLSRDPEDRDAFTRHWEKILADDTGLIKTIVYGGIAVGNVLSYVGGGELSIGYWIAREHWGKGIATRALELFLEIQTSRPLFARVAKDNGASLRVLRKCGFVVTGEGREYSRARGEEVAEVILRLGSAKEDVDAS